MAGASPPGALAAAEKTPAPGRVVTIILCAVLVVFAALLAVAPVWVFGFASETCNVTCNGLGLTAGTFLALIGSAVAVVLGIVLAVIRLRGHGRFAWVFPLAGGLVVLTVTVIGVLVAASSANFLSS